MITKEEIRFGRACLQLTKGELGELSGYSRQHINNVEQGHRQVTDSIGAAIIAAFETVIIMRHKRNIKMGRLLMQIKNRIENDSIYSKNDMSSGG